MKKYLVAFLSLFLSLHVVTAITLTRGQQVEIPNIDDTAFYIEVAKEKLLEQNLPESNTSTEMQEKFRAGSMRTLVDYAEAVALKGRQVEIPNTDDIAYYVAMAFVVIKKEQLGQELSEISDSMKITEELKTAKVQALIQQALTSEINHADIVEISLLSGGQDIEAMISFLRREGVSQRDIERGVDVAGVSSVLMARSARRGR